MADQEIRRNLAVLVHGDVVGSTDLVQRNETLAHQRITDAFRRFSLDIGRYGGTVREIRGDALVAEFSRASDAVCAALAFQQANVEHNATLGGDLAPELRVGVALGEVVFSDGALTGPGVVLAQRVEQLAAPNGVCVTPAVQEALPQRLPFVRENLGPHEVKGFAEPIHVYRVRLQPGEAVPPPEGLVSRRTSWSLGPWIIAKVIVVAIIAGTVSFWFGARESGQGPSGAAVVAAPLQLPDRPSIAVLPFDNMSSDAEQGYFADGISEDLTTRLSKLAGLFVISRNSAFSYKGKRARAEQVSRELGVRYLLEGSVRRSGSTVRVNAQLIDGPTGDHIWAEIYDGSLTDIFALQDQITNRIVAALELELSDADRKLVYAEQTHSAKAYDAFLKGWEQYLQNTPEALPKALASFQDAVTLDPEYDRALAGIAATYQRVLQNGWGYVLGIDDMKLGTLQRESLARAMERPTSLALAVAARVDLRHGRHDEAVARAARAVELDASDSQAHLVLGRALVFSGRPKEALAALEKSLRLDPNNPADHLAVAGMAHLLLGDYGTAATVLERALSAEPEQRPNGPTAALASTYAHLGRGEDASRMAEALIELFRPVTWLPESNLAEIMTYFPFRRARDARTLGEGLLRAGICCQQDLDNVLASKRED